MMNLAPPTLPIFLSGSPPAKRRPVRLPSFTVAAALILLLGGCATTSRTVALPTGPPPPPPVMARPEEPPAPQPELKITEEDEESGKLAPPLKAPKIVIKKGEKKLFLYSEEKLLKTYPVKLGLDPVGDKARRGDMRTPEGSYYICIKNPRSKYHLSLGLSYPGIEDAQRGLTQKLISKKDHDRIVEKIGQKAIPPWDTPLGGEIFIHGGADTWEWTYGCVALRNRDIEELFRAIPVGAEVVIQQ